MLRVEPKALQFIKDIFDAKKVVAAVCHAPWLLIETGIAKGRKILMETLRKSVGGASCESKSLKKGAKKPRKAAAGQKEMLMPIAGKKPAKQAAAKKPSAKPQRKSA